MGFIVNKDVSPVRNTSATLISTNDVFEKGRIIFETDTNRGKVGDGVTAYVDLSYPEWTYEEVPTTSGTDTYTATFSEDILLVYFNMMRLRVKFTNANTGASTINLNGLGAKDIKKNVSTALSAGDIVAGGIYDLTYDGTNFQIGTRSLTDLSDYGRVVMTNGNQTNSSNPVALADITDLVTSTLLANTRYYFWGAITVGCDNTGGVLFAINLPAGASMQYNLITRTSSATNVLVQFVTAINTANATAFCTQNIAQVPVAVSGEFSIGATAGVAQFRFRNNTAAQTATIYQIGTAIQWVKIP